MRSQSRLWYLTPENTSGEDFQHHQKGIDLHFGDDGLATILKISCSIIEVTLISQLFIYFVENLRYIKKKAVTGIVLIAEPPRITFCHVRVVQTLNFAHQNASIKPYRDTIAMNAL